MARTALDEGEWGAISTHQAPDGRWAAQARLHDPVKKRVVQVRRFAGTAELAVEVLERALRERSAATPVTLPEYATTFGDVLAWWWSEVRPTQGWSDSTTTSMDYARKHLEPLGQTEWPLPAGQQDDIADRLGKGRTADLARRLLFQIVRDAESAVPL